MMRTMLALRLSGYGRETKRPAIGYGQRPENRQRADGWAEVGADGWAEGEGGLAGLSSCAEVRGRRVRAEGEGEYGFSSLLKQKIKGKNLLRHLQRLNFFFKIFML